MLAFGSNAVNTSRHRGSPLEAWSCACHSPQPALHTTWARTKWNHGGGRLRLTLCELSWGLTPRFQLPSTAQAACQTPRRSKCLRGGQGIQGRGRGQFLPRCPAPATHPPLPSPFLGRTMYTGDATARVGGDILKYRWRFFPPLFSLLQTAKPPTTCGH